MAGSVISEVFFNGLTSFSLTALLYQKFFFICMNRMHGWRPQCNQIVSIKYERGVYLLDLTLVMG